MQSTSNNQQQKVAIVTGANSGIGFETAKALIFQGYRVFFACRSEEKTNQAIQKMEQRSSGAAEYLHLDLGDLDSVKRCAESFLEKDLPLHLLICNAGLAGQKGMTASGFELSFGTCHVGHFLLTSLLTERLQQSKPSRVVVVASEAHKQAKHLDLSTVQQPTKSTTGFKEYAVAKLANILFAKALSQKLKGTGVTSYALHPGVVATNVWRSVPWPFEKLIKLFMINSEQGAATTLYCATEPLLDTESGFYYDKCMKVLPTEIAQSDELANDLWEKSESWVKSYL
ncbi:MAG: SDR family oxidoreductase [Pseudomonadales bacterium]|nr:SDR family oxidoreductase [Pseudomonadales bacterium]